MRQDYSVELTFAPRASGAALNMVMRVCEQIYGTQPPVLAMPAMAGPTDFLRISLGISALRKFAVAIGRILISLSSDKLSLAGEAWLQEHLSDDEVIHLPDFLDALRIQYELSSPLIISCGSLGAGISYREGENDIAIANNLFRICCGLEAICRHMQDEPYVIINSTILDDCSTLSVLYDQGGRILVNADLMKPVGNTFEIARSVTIEFDPDTFRVREYDR